MSKPFKPEMESSQVNGYPTNKPCVICGEINECQIEPRFLYVVCKDHRNVPPSEIARKNDE